MILLKWLDDQFVGGSNVGRLSKPSPLQVGLQVPCGFRAQAAAEDHLREHSPSTGTDLPCAGKTKGMPNRGGSFDAGPCAYVHRDSTEASGSVGHRLPER